MIKFSYVFKTEEIIIKLYRISAGKLYDHGVIYKEYRD